MFSGGNFPVKIEIQKSTAEFANRYGMPDVGTGLHPPAPAGTRRHPPAPARRPAGLARPATGHGHRHRLATGCGHGKLTRVDAAKRRHGCGRL